MTSDEQSEDFTIKSCVPPTPKSKSDLPSAEERKLATSFSNVSLAPSKDTSPAKKSKIKLYY
jgi:hypothetical protein